MSLTPKKFPRETFGPKVFLDNDIGKCEICKKKLSRDTTVLSCANTGNIVSLNLKVIYEINLFFAEAWI